MISEQHRSCSIVIVVDSPFSRNSFRVAQSRHSTGDKTWDLALAEAIKAAITYKQNFPQSRLSMFKYTPPPLTEELLLAALQRLVAEGDLAANQYKKVLDMAQIIKKEEEEKALQSKRSCNHRRPSFHTWLKPFRPSYPHLQSRKMRRRISISSSGR